MERTGRIQCVVFDLGKVLVDFNYDLAINRLNARRRRGGDSVDFLEAAGTLDAYERGALSSEGFCETIQKEFDLEITYEEFVAAFSDIFSEIPGMIALSRRLRQVELPTYILSNTNPLAIAWILEKFPFFSEFEGYIYSYEVGCMKPESRIYEELERVSSFRGESILYMDDRLENIEAARRRGWTSIHHREPDTTIAEVENYISGLKVA